MTSRPWLIDKSALVRLGDSQDSVEWAARIQRGRVRIATVTLLKAGHPARTTGEMQQVLHELPVAMTPTEMSPRPQSVGRSRCWRHWPRGVRIGRRQFRMW